MGGPMLKLYLIHWSDGKWSAEARDEVTGSVVWSSHVAGYPLCEDRANAAHIADVFVTNQAKIYGRDPYRWERKYRTEKREARVRTSETTAAADHLHKVLSGRAPTYTSNPRRPGLRGRR